MCIDGENTMATSRHHHNGATITGVFDMTKASIQAVAKEAGVSVSTVSRTFAKPDLVLPETRDKVMAAAEKLDYSISRSAAALKSGQSFRIALLASETITTWFNANILQGSTRCCALLAMTPWPTPCATPKSVTISLRTCPCAAMQMR